VHVGQILKVLEGEYFPADMILLKSADTHGLCYVETKSLDGETNLKTRHANKAVMKQLESIGDDNYS
jgi:P-type E1-E2 ATPase